MHKKNCLFLLSVGILALLLGVGIYILDRPATQTYLVPERLSMYVGTDSTFGVLGNYLPTFLHAFAFCLMTIAILRCHHQHAVIVCLMWLVIDTVFEITQHDSISPFIVSLIPDWFDKIPLLENAGAYFGHGRFDPLDLLSILLGVAAAYFLVRFYYQDMEDTPRLSV